MKYLFFIMIVLSSVIWISCDSDKMCEVKEDCRIFCLSYESNQTYYTCNKNSCVCLSKSKMSCTGEENETVCKEICDLYEPGATPECADNLCSCRPKDETAPAEPDQTVPETE